MTWSAECCCAYIANQRLTSDAQQRMASGSQGCVLVPANLVGRTRVIKPQQDFPTYKDTCARHRCITCCSSTFFPYNNILITRTVSPHTLLETIAFVMHGTVYYTAGFELALKAVKMSVHSVRPPTARDVSQIFGLPGAMLHLKVPCMNIFTHGPCFTINIHILSHCCPVYLHP